MRVSAVSRTLSRALLRRSLSAQPSSTLGPVTALSQDEADLQRSVADYAQNVVKPLVRKMDDESKLDPGLIKGLFEQGLMGIEISQDHGGLGCSFMGACIAIEELAKVDASVSVFVDVQNTIGKAVFWTPTATTSPPCF